MWPLIKKNIPNWWYRETEVAEEKNTTFRSVKLQRKDKTASSLEVRIHRKQQFFSIISNEHNTTQNNPDEDCEGEIRNLFNFSIWWLFSFPRSRSISHWERTKTHKYHCHISTVRCYAISFNDWKIPSHKQRYSTILPLEVLIRKSATFHICAQKVSVISEQKTKSLAPDGRFGSILLQCYDYFSTICISTHSTEWRYSKQFLMFIKCWTHKNHWKSAHWKYFDLSSKFMVHQRFFELWMT